MTMSPSQLAALPTAPTLSEAFREASRHAHEGPVDALTRAFYGSTNPCDYASLVTPEHTIAWGAAVIATAYRISPLVNTEWPDSAWDATTFAEAVSCAHRELTAWANRSRTEELSGLFRQVARQALNVEK
ncbi:hypothetical protein AB0G98_21290 [Streptomyces sp. NPDC020196]|uniref:hypothetical protein n=1 Tax=Streptomyces sp. NPDC020196 TaxID=3156656 RepID=UPI0033EB3534